MAFYTDGRALRLGLLIFSLHHASHVSADDVYDAQHFDYADCASDIFWRRSRTSIPPTMLLISAGLARRHLPMIDARLCGDTACH